MDWSGRLRTHAMVIAPVAIFASPFSNTHVYRIVFFVRSVTFSRTSNSSSNRSALWNSNDAARRRSSSRKA